MKVSNLQINVSVKNSSGNFHSALCIKDLQFLQYPALCRKTYGTKPAAGGKKFGFCIVNAVQFHEPFKHLWNSIYYRPKYFYASAPARYDVTSNFLYLKNFSYVFLKLFRCSEHLKIKPPEIDTTSGNPHSPLIVFSSVRRNIFLFTEALIPIFCAVRP